MKSPRFWRPTLALIGAQLLAIIWTGWGNLGVAFGLHPESILLFDFVAPCAALVALAFWCSQSGNRRDAFAFSLLTISFYFIGHSFITARFEPRFWRDGFSQLDSSHLFWWALVLVLGNGAGWLGQKFTSRYAFPVLLVGLMTGLTCIQAIKSRSLWASHEIEVQPDGTTIRFEKFDLRQVNFALYDADDDDSNPHDDFNATWLGQPIRRVWSKLEARGETPLCLVNGGFFGGESLWVGRHEAPISSRSHTFYNVSALEHNWPQQIATLVWKRVGNSTIPEIHRHIAFSDLENYDGALGGVRVLIENGQPATLKPGMGGSTLKCSRTSIGWKGNDFWILSVRDPDGEKSSLLANRREKSGGPKEQVGGFDVREVQQFWQQHGVPNAVLFDGGESAQIAQISEAGFEVSHSSYHFSRTPFFLNHRPIRFVWPMLPPDEANGGVLNWFAVVRN